ncbi:MAG: hypothetical protein AB8G05_20290 [Oligoflexales bacterium]
MKFIIHKAMLEKSLQRVLSAMSSSEVSYVGMKLEENSETIELAMQDTIVAAYTQAPCHNEGSGTAFVPAKLFSDVVRELPDVDLIVEVSGARCQITAGQSIEMKLPVRGDISWKVAPTLQESYQLEIQSSQLHYMIEQVNPCLDPKSNRNYAAVGFLKQIKPNTLRLVGTNGFRLSFVDVALPLNEKSLQEGVCLTKKALSEIYRMSSEGFDKVEIEVSDEDRQIVTKVPGYQLYIKLSTVSYPNYQSVIPETEGTAVSCERRSLGTVVKRVLLAAGKSRSLHISMKEGWMTLQTRDAGSSEGREIVGLPNAPGIECGFAVNGGYLSDILSTMVSDSADIVVHNPEDPVVVVPGVEPSSCYSRHMLMQIQEGYAENHGE